MTTSEKAKKIILENENSEINFDKPAPEPMPTAQKQIEGCDKQIIEKLILQGDISQMSPTQKVYYYRWLCNSLGLNPATQPFSIIKFQGREQLYAKKDATDQLRKIHNVSVVEMEDKTINDIYIVRCKVQDKTRRTDFGTGAVQIKGLNGDSLCNAMMKAETKAKRRATLSVCGLGILDESETDTIDSYQTHLVDVKLAEEFIDEAVVQGKILQDKSNVAELKPVDKKINVNKEVRERLLFIANQSSDSDKKTLLDLSLLKSLTPDHTRLIELIKERNEERIKERKEQC